MSQFSQISLSSEEESIIRQSLLSGIFPDSEIYPVRLLQLYGNIPRHNRSPLKEKSFTILPDRSKYLHRVFRFYFDGLVCMFELPGATSVRVREVPDFYVGGNKFLTVQMMDFDNSREKIEMVMHSVDSFNRYPKFRNSILSGSLAEK